MTIKLISLNVWSGGILFPQIIDFLKAEDADIVILQEVQVSEDPGAQDRFRTMEVLHEQLGYPFQEFARAFILSLPEGKVLSGNAILSKYPIKRTSHDFLLDSVRPEYQDIPEHWAIEPRLLQGAVLDTPAGEVNVFNMHGVWDLDGDSPSPARQTMVDRTLAAIKGKPNVLLGGDTNATTGNPLLRDIEKQLTSVFGSELTSTFNMRRKDKPGYATAAVDHIYVSPDIKILSHACPDIDISDHLPLVVSLEVG